MTNQTLKLKETYFGFTNNIKPLQKGKMEKSLDMLIRYDSKVMTEKEFVYAKLQDGYTPSIEENYSYYSRRTDAMTKPKTLYKLDNEGTYSEINKTLYNYAIHLLENNFIDPTIAANYIQEEQRQLDEQIRLEKEEKERIKLENKLKSEEANTRHQEKLNQWHEAGTKLMNDNIKEAILNAIEEHWEQITLAFPNTEKESLTIDIINRFTGQLGNEEFIKGNVSYVFYDDINQTNISNKIYKSIYKIIFNVLESDSKQTLTAKVKAFYNGKEYKGGNYSPIEQEDFYIFVRVSEKFELRQGEKKTISGLTCFISKNEKGMYTVTESRTGLLLGSPQTTKKEALENAKQGIEKAGERLESLIKNSINRYGLSPLYKEEVTV